MTPYSRIYDAFLAKILEDEWEHWLIEEAEQDWRQIMEAAIPWFKFPRHDLLTRTDNDPEIEVDGFSEDLTTQEIQIIANYMKCEWLNRCIMSWENIKPLYEEKDFSPANLLGKLNETLERERKQALRMESYYYRSIDGKPFDYTSLAGKQE